MTDDYKIIQLNQGHTISVPKSAYPWISEWTWTYNPELGQIIRVENGRTMYLYNELIKHNAGENTISLTDEVIDILFSEHPAYEKLTEEYTLRVSNDKYTLPNPYQLISLCLTNILRIYFRWLNSGHCYMLNLHTGDGVPVFTYEKRDDDSVYAVSEEFPRLSDWMYGEWSGEVEGTPPKPLPYLDQTCQVVYQTMGYLFETVNNHVDFSEIDDFFEGQDQSLEAIAELVHLLIESYPTPAR